ncbi:MAG: response regulator transcription factor [Candidatus Woesearchaeota archaeon]
MTLSAVAPPSPSPAPPGRCRVRVLLLDDEEIVHWGFRLLLANQPWAERCIPARDAASALQLAWRFEPHVALIDTGTLEGSPAGFCRELTRACAQARILLLTHTDAVAPSTIRALGASGFVSRSWAARDLLQAIRRASVGLAVAPCRPPAQSSLSARQQEILQLIADGATNGEIAVRLYLSRDTVKQHTSALYRKLGARNRTHAVQTARRQGLIAV